MTLEEIFMPGYERRFDTNVGVVPSILYHVTFEQNLQSIMTNGLGGKGRKKRWDFSTDFIHLASSPATAKLYANDVGYDFFEHITFVLLAVTVDPSKLEKDPNTRVSGCYIYKGVIPPSQINVREKFSIK